jgi:hypothetical protein
LDSSMARIPRPGVAIVFCKYRHSKIHQAVSTPFIGYSSEQSQDLCNLYVTNNLAAHIQGHILRQIRSSKGITTDRPIIILHL